MTIKAIYEKGIFRPTETVSLPEGTSVEVMVQENSGAPLPDRAEIVKFLEELRAIPPDGPEPDDGLSGSLDHDKILYGGPNGAL